MRGCLRATWHALHCVSLLALIASAWYIALPRAMRAVLPPRVDPALRTRDGHCRVPPDAPAHATVTPECRVTLGPPRDERCVCVPAVLLNCTSVHTAAADGSVVYAGPRANLRFNASEEAALAAWFWPRDVRPWGEIHVYVCQ